MNYYGKIKVIIVEEDKAEIENIKTSLEEGEKFVVVGTAVGGKEGLRLLRERDCDVVIINILLSGISGLSILESYREVKGRERPAFILFISPKTEHLTKKASELGADYFIYKPYNMEIMIKSVIEVYKMKNIDLYNYQNMIEANKFVTYENPEQFVSTLLKAAGFTVSLKGYAYIKMAVLLEIEERNVLKSITKHIYPYIAKKYDTTPSCVERAMRNSISKAWEIKDGLEINKILGTDMENAKKPSNSLFIKSVVELYDNLS